MGRLFSFAGRDTAQVDGRPNPRRLAPGPPKNPWPPAPGRLVFLLALLALPAFPQADSPAAAGVPAAPSALDSSSASESPKNDAASSPAEQPYGGPSLLGRDVSPGHSAPQVNLTPYFEISGVYDSGLNGIAIDSQGVARSAAAAGTQYTIGIGGARAWRHTSLALDYNASASLYSSSNSYNNSRQSLSLGVTRQLSRHTTLSVKEAASAYTRSFMQPTVSSAYLPALDIYGNRTSMFSTQIALFVQKTARFSFMLAGNGGLTHQASRLVYDIGAVGATATAQYRLSRRATAGASYSFSHYIYPGSFSSVYYHSATGDYAVALSRRLEFSISAGFMRSESQYLQAVPLDPILAYLIGVRAAMVVSHQVFKLPSGGARLSRAFSRGSAYISGDYSVVPGNGLFLASVATNFSAGYNYTGWQRWNLSAGGAYSKEKSIGTALGRYENVNANFSASRQISRFTHAVIAFSALRYQSSNVSYYNRLMYQARIGLGFSPGKIPLGPR